MIYKLSEVYLAMMFTCGGLLMVGLMIFAVKGFLAGA